MLRAASASGRTRTRTAYRLAPKTLTCATPVIVDSVGEIRCSAKSCRSDGASEGEVIAISSTGASAGLTLRYAGGDVMSSGSARCARSNAACTSSAAPSISRPSSNSSVSEVLPSVLVELMTFKPGIVWNCFSSGSATEVAIVSGLAPGSAAETLMIGVS